MKILIGLLIIFKCVYSQRKFLFKIVNISNFGTFNVTLKDQNTLSFSITVNKT
jgi:hypothetical protein